MGASYTPVWALNVYHFKIDIDETNLFAANDAQRPNSLGLNGIFHGNFTA